MAMIKEKLKGHKPIIAAAPERGNVVNLMDALKASLGAGEAAGAEPEQGRGRAGRGGRRRRPRPRRRPPRRRPRARRDARPPARPSASSARSRPSRAGWPRARSSAHGGAAAPRRRPRATTHVVFGRRAARAHRRRRDRGAGRGGARRRAGAARARTASCGCSACAGRRRGAALAAAALLDAVGAGARRRSTCCALFDAFERDGEPCSFRDLILARKYAGLIAGGAGWGAIARSVHRFGPAASLTAKALHARRRAGDLRPRTTTG